MRSTVRPSRLVAGLATAATVAALLPNTGRADTGPPIVDADDIRFTPGTQLHYGSAREAGLVPQHVDHLPTTIAGFLEPSPTYPQYAGAVELVGSNGVIASHEAVGHALRYSSYDKTTGAVELPRDQWLPMERDTVFDVASISKLFTSLVAVQLMERGSIALDDPVVEYVPEFGQHGKDAITVRHLLTHTSGLPPSPSPSLCTYGTNDERWAAVYATTPRTQPDTEYVYSDINMMALQRVVEVVTGQPLDAVVRQRITGPLHMTDTMYNPPAPTRARAAATEYQPWTGRGVIRGTVHDENAYCLGGVAGHAGVFSTAHDLAVLAQTILDGGRYGKIRILGEGSVRSLLTNFTTAFPGNDHGLGFELNQLWYMDGLASPVSAGHTGYTGTSLVIDPLSHSFAILLTNRVHPTRDWGSNNPSRRAVARDLALALPVKPATGTHSWFSGVGDDRTATLGVPLEMPAEGGRLAFDLWYDTETDADVGALQASTDDGATWSDVPLDLRAGRHTWSTGGEFSGYEGKQWLSARSELPGGVTDLRWKYTTDPLYQGRGVYVDDVRAWDSDGDLIFDDDRPSDTATFDPEGWTPSRT